MIPRVNNVVLLPHVPDWSQTPKVQRRWQSAIASAVSGVEERSTLRQTPIRSLAFGVTPFDALERALLDDRIRAALLDGAAAVPWWGRGLALASPASGTTVTLADTVPTGWVPAAGSHIAFVGDWATPGGAQWEIAEVESVAGRVLTLSAALTNTWTRACWELLAGKLTVSGGETLTGHTGTYSLKVDGYRGVVDPYAFMPPTPSVCPADSYMVPDLDSALAPVIERVPVIDANLLSLVYQVQMTSEAADGDQAAAVWEWADYATGLESATWATETSAVRETSDPTLWRVGMKYRQAYYLRVTITTFGTALTSEPIVIPGLYPEAMMRVLQERREDTGGAAFTWPYSAPAYPADGFFDSTIDSLGNTAHATILSALRTAIRTTGFLGGFLNPWSGTTVGGTFGRYVPRANAFDSTWALTPGSGFTLPAYDPVLSESNLSTAITTANWSSYWDDIGRICLWVYKRFYRPARSGGQQTVGVATQSSGDMKVLILSSGGLGETAQTMFDAAAPGASSDPFGVRTTVTPTSVDTYVWGQVYNAPGEVRLTHTTGTWYETIEDRTGTMSFYRSAYFTGYDLSKIAVVGQDGVTPYHALTGLTDAYYVGSGHPTNRPAQELTNPSLSGHLQFVHQGTIPYTSGDDVIREANISSGLGAGSVDFLWLDVFNTSSRPLRNLGVEMVCYCVWYRSPRPEDEHWTHTIHLPVEP